MSPNLKQSICALFEVHQEPSGIARVITPLEYPGSGDKIVIRVRPSDNGKIIDENGEAVLYASLAGGDVDSDTLDRWSQELQNNSPVTLDLDETLRAFASSDDLIAPYIFKVAQAAQQLHAIATARSERKSSDFKDRVASIIDEVAARLNRRVTANAELPITGDLYADHLIDTPTPLIVITATSAARLLEAQIIYMQYRAEKKSGLIFAIAESQATVTRKQFERAGYFTHKTVVFSPDALEQLVSTEIQSQH
jgi:hypothetical protein